MEFKGIIEATTEREAALSAYARWGAGNYKVDVLEGQVSDWSVYDEQGQFKGVVKAINRKGAEDLAAQLFGVVQARVDKLASGKKYFQIFKLSQEELIERPVRTEPESFSYYAQLPQAPAAGGAPLGVGGLPPITTAPSAAAIIEQKIEREERRPEVMKKKQDEELVKVERAFGAIITKPKPKALVNRIMGPIDILDRGNVEVRSPGYASYDASTLTAGEIKALRMANPGVVFSAGGEHSIVYDAETGISTGTNWAGQGFTYNENTGEFRYT